MSSIQNLKLIATQNQQSYINCFQNSQILQYPDSKASKMQQKVDQDKHERQDGIYQKQLQQYLQVKITKFIQICKKIKIIMKSLPEQGLRNALDHKLNEICQKSDLKSVEKEKYLQVFVQLRDQKLWLLTQKLQSLLKKIKQLKLKMNKKKEKQ